MGKSVPFPEGYQMLEVESISHVAYRPESGRADILLISKLGQKVCLDCDLRALDLAVLQIINEARPADDTAKGLQLAVIAGGKA